MDKLKQAYREWVKCNPNTVQGRRGIAHSIAAKKIKHPNKHFCKKRTKG